MSEIKLVPIGLVQSSLQNLEDCPLQESENAPQATVAVFPNYATAMKDIKPGDGLWVFTWLGLADRSILETKPRNNAAAKLTGVFSTRSPHRPNPIGMHAVIVVAVVDHHTLIVSGLEVLNQTLVIDIKPQL